MEMAVTIDDLPWNGGHPDGYDTLDATRRLVAALKQRSIPATAFVNCDRVYGQAPLKVWTDADVELGNHSASHMDLSRSSLAAWTEDVRRCDSKLEEWTGAVRWFRFPYLHQGETVEKRDGAYANVAALGERVAQVSIDNEEWRLAAGYARADAALQGKIAAAYPAHLREASAHFRELAVQKTGRDIQHVLLVHVNMLAADHLGAALDALRADGWSFVTLDAAMSDPVYALPDVYTSTFGPSWLHRIAPTLPDEFAWEKAKEAEVRALVGG
ncbi:polysaccharide deacetylase [Deltaproteobacteria bacterium]|nr:polysaccharide deacetylase [Deltaproteobacteria bacterium]